MKYRRFGKLDWDVSVLGFGAMRLPIIGKDRGNIEEDLAIRMIRYAIDEGVNYIDTAYPYHDGKSEVLVGKVLQGGYRGKVKVATKMPSWKIETKKDMDRFLEEQLKRLQLESFDFYLLHGLTGERWSKLLELDVLEWCEGKIEEGKFDYLGFSFHDEYEVFREIVDGYDDWVLSQIQYNYMDWDYQAGTKGLKYAASKGLAVVVMEPVAGGMLAVTPPEEIQAIWDEAECKRTPVEWALRWVWDHPEVSVALSGMSTMEQVIENIQTANNSDPHNLTEKESDLISRVRAKYNEIGFIGCTDCKYCLPCPEGVEIPVILDLLNQYTKEREGSEERERIREQYKQLISPEKMAKRCAKCGECEDKCPQDLPIKQLINEAAMWLESDR